MNQNTERAEALIRLRKLINQTTDRGRTEDETNTAMKQMNKLMAVYNISLDEVDLSDEPMVTYIYDTGAKKRSGFNEAFKGIAHYCDLVYYLNTGSKFEWNKHNEYRKVRKNITFTFFGRETDIEMAKYLLSLIKNTMNLELKMFKASEDYKCSYSRRSDTCSFQTGMGTRLRYRLYELKKEQNEEIAKTRQTGSDIIVLKNAKVQEEFKKKGIKLVSIPNYNRVTSSIGYDAGSSAGNNVNLSRPVSSQTSPNTLALTYSS